MSLRPTPEQIQRYEQAYGEPLPEKEREAYIAFTFLKETLQDADLAPERIRTVTILHAMMTLVAAKNPWEVADRILNTIFPPPDDGDTTGTLYPIPPSPTRLFSLFLETVSSQQIKPGNNSITTIVGHEIPDEGFGVEDFDFPGAFAFESAIAVKRKHRATEIVLGVDMYGNTCGSKHESVYCITWYVNGLVYIGIWGHDPVPDGEGLVFGEIEWDNPYWNNYLAGWSARLMQGTHDATVGEG